MQVEVPFGRGENQQIVECHRETDDTIDRLRINSQPLHCGNRRCVARPAVVCVDRLCAAVRLAPTGAAADPIRQGHLRHDPPEAVEDRSAGAHQRARITFAMASSYPYQRDFAHAHAQLMGAAAR